MSSTRPGQHRRDKERTRTHRPTRLLMSVLLVITGTVFVTGAAAVVKGSQANATTPGTPGTPQAGTTIFSESFENAITNAANGAESYSNPASTTYVGAGGQTYTGSPSWINGTRCNGVILSNSNTTALPWALSGPAGSGIHNCSESSGVRSWEFLRMLARAMGQQFTPASPDTDHVVSSYTECQTTDTSGGTCDIIPSGPTNGIMFKTVQPITTIPGHYYVFGVKTAYINCANGAAADPSYQFALIDGGAVKPIGSPLDGCQATSDPNVTASTQNVTLNVGGAFGTITRPVRVDSMTTNQAFRATSTTAGIEMYNNNGTTNGNDGAFDDIRLIDVTPQLDKSFSPPSIAQGGTATLTFTVTNTNELDAKPGWSFTDNLPSGLTVATPSGTSTTCPNGQITVTGGTVLGFTGDLSQGMQSCTFTINVTTNTVGTYTNTGCVDSTGATIPNCTPNVTNPNGVNPPGGTTLTVTPVVDLAITKTAAAPDYVAGGPISYTVTVTNNGPSDAVGAQVSDPIPSAIAGATWTCAGTGGATCTASGTGNISDTVNVPAGGKVVYTVTGTVAPGTTGNLANTATVVPPTGTTDNNCPSSPGTGCSSTATSPGASISIKKTASPTVVSAAGQTVTVFFLAKGNTVIGHASTNTTVDAGAKADWTVKSTFPAPATTWCALRGVA